VTTEIQVEKNIIVNSTKLENAIGLSFARFSAWVKEKGGEIVLVMEPPSLERISKLW
jgi:hypothetical protein